MLNMFQFIDKSVDTVPILELIKSEKKFDNSIKDFKKL